MLEQGLSQDFAWRAASLLPVYLTIWLYGSYPPKLDFRARYLPEFVYDATASLPRHNACRGCTRAVSREKGDGSKMKDVSSITMRLA